MIILNLLVKNYELVMRRKEVIFLGEDIGYECEENLREILPILCKGLGR
jgi:hypothetical protein